MLLLTMRLKPSVCLSLVPAASLCAELASVIHPNPVYSVAETVVIAVPVMPEAFTIINPFNPVYRTTWYTAAANLSDGCPAARGAGRRH
jgi:hypothetical protein